MIVDICGYLLQCRLLSAGTVHITLLISSGLTEITGLENTRSSQRSDSRTKNGAVPRL